VKNAVIVLSHEGEPALTERDRDLFWDVFGVPTFEQLLTHRNELIASECDAHDGLHLRGAVCVREGWELDKSPCDCGDPRPRLVAVRGAAEPALQLCVEQP